MNTMDQLKIDPEPTIEEAAAIAAAVTIGASAVPEPRRRTEVPRWRFSGRWWSAPVSVRRPRP